MEMVRRLIISASQPTVEMRHQLIVKNIPSLSLDLVYRTLSTFEKMELIHRIENIENHGCFAVSDDQYHHFICDTCGRVTDFTGRLLIPCTFRTTWKKVVRFIDTMLLSSRPVRGVFIKNKLPASSGSCSNCLVQHTSDLVTLLKN